MPIRFLTAGESHGPALTVIIDGLPAGLPLTSEVIDHELARRQSGAGAGPRMKKEHDVGLLLSGVLAGVTTGAPIAILIRNLDHENWHGKEIPASTIPRPGHADLVGAIKYGYTDLRPSLERASARETASRGAAGAVCKQFLRQFEIIVEGYVASIGKIDADLDPIPLDARFALSDANPVRCPDHKAAVFMQTEIKQVMQDKDTLGGVIEVLVRGLPPGLGSFAQWDRRLDARLGAALLSIPAIKGVEIGPAFANTRLTGTSANDPIRLENDLITRPSNLSGGLEGGVTTGQPLILRAAMKPIASTLTPQASVDLSNGDEVPTSYVRSDFCPVPRAVPVLEAMVAIILADVLVEKLGGDSIGEMLPRFSALHRSRLSDLHMNGEPVEYWPSSSSELPPW